MEDIPPSYTSINPTVLELLPPYLETASLVNLCLVSRSYYSTFISHLWGSPASHFVPLTGNSPNGTRSTDPANIEVTGSHNDMVYVALTRFKRTLRKARLSTRLLCHTLHLPPALSEIYGGPNVSWLREVLDRLPALQSLCVAGLPFFDHHSLVNVHRPRSSSGASSQDQDEYHIYPVKMLLAMKEPNATSVGISMFLPHLPNLVYLDLSYTSPARDINVLSSLSALEDLQALKLRGIGLRDMEAEVLANAIGLRVRLLDVAENQLTDMGLRSILQACFWRPSGTTERNSGSHQAPPYNNATDGNIYSRRHLESWPVGLPPSPDFLSLDAIRTVGLDKALMTQLTNPLTGRLAFEDIPHAGITHLYISGNPGVSIEGIRSVLSCGRLHVLDAGEVNGITAMDLTILHSRRRTNSNTLSNDLTANSAFSRDISGTVQSIRRLKSRKRSPSSSTHSGDASSMVEEQDSVVEDFKWPGAEKLVTVLHEKASRNLTHLRIEHTLVTSVLDLAKDHAERNPYRHGRQELPASLETPTELDSNVRMVVEAPGSRHYAVEMPSDPNVFELDSTPAPQRVELVGDIIHFAISPPIGDSPAPKPDEGTQSPIRADGAFAPEPVIVPETGDGQDEASDEEVILDASGSGIRRKKIDTARNIDSVLSPVQPPSPLRVVKHNDSAPKAPNVLNDSHRTGSDGHLQIDVLTNLRPKPPFARLHPFALPNLRTLILTNVPTNIPSTPGTILENIKNFITACAAEAHLAVLKSRTNYSLPPGRARHEAEREHARTLFALQTIILEMSAPPDVGQQRGWKHTRERLNISKSSTGDMDSEAFWSAAENDFSFFGEDGEEHDECGIYDQEPEKYFPTATFDDKIVISSEGEGSTMSSGRSFAVNRDNPQSPIFSPLSTSPHSSFFGGTLSPATPVTRQGTIFHSPRDLPLLRNRRNSNDPPRRSSPAPGTMQEIPERPLSARFTHRSLAEMPGTIPTIQHHRAPTSNPVPQEPEPPTMIDVVSELAKWRKERKAAYEQECLRQRRINPAYGSKTSARVADSEIYVEGHWKGDIKVVRNTKASNKNKGRMERTGNVDLYGNYFEGGYLYR